jgi:hypothetical protein
MMASDPFREYESVVKPVEPRAAFADIELMAATFTIRVFAMRSKFDLAAVLSPGYFDDVTDIRFRRHDRIELVADWDGAGEHALLAVESVDKHGVPKLLLLQKYRR